MLDNNHFHPNLSISDTTADTDDRSAAAIDRFVVVVVSDEDFDVGAVLVVVLVATPNVSVDGSREKLLNKSVMFRRSTTDSTTEMRNISMMSITCCRSAIK